MASSHGQKVTTDPETLNNPKNENPGVVTSDSLAAESIQEGGSFAANADARGPMDQPSRSVNTNTTDTSNATRLDPAPDAEARLASEEWSESAQLNAGRSLGSSSGNAGAVGATTDDVTGAPPTADTLLPKGRNLTEGGFDADAPNASYNTDIGSKNDPGRAALGKFEAENVPTTGGGARQQEVTGDGAFDVLKDARA